MTDSGVRQDLEDHYRRICKLESQLLELVALVDTLTDKLILAGVLVKRKGK